ncbi:hypothetical protein PIB30_029620 [Stylosanthes scabra]|uniref:Uncharacterized protein n=1 Tax=Stylosanthes scabra TaxID=79078 RepID=A0ABU6QB77_9FABA|nr:hypothetical protein [Stylosanthes scabra]
MVQPTFEEIVVADRDIIYWLDNISHVARDINRLWLDEMTGENVVATWWAAVCPRAVVIVEVVGGDDELERGPPQLSHRVERAVARPIRQGRAKRARLEFDGSQGQVLNNPASAPSHLFMALVGTPLSAYMGDHNVEGSEPASAPTPKDPPTDGVQMRELH